MAKTQQSAGDWPGDGLSRREAILQAALECFDEHGFAATTIGEVRRRSEASIGSIYHHFGGKEEIAAELYIGGLHGYQRGFLEVLERHDAAEPGIRALVGYHLGWVEQSPRLARFLMNRRETELRLATEARLRELNREFLPRVRAWLEARAEAGELRELPSDLWEPVLLGPCQELARHWLAGRARIPLRQAASELSEVTWNAVRAVG